MVRLRLVLVGAFVVSSVVIGVPDAAMAKKPPPPQWIISNPPLDPIDVGGEPSRVLQGTLNGAAYIVEVPPTWNGELVMWAHGYRGGRENPVLSVDPPAYGLRQHLLDEGFAWAASSYDANGYDVASGVRSTRDLVSKFRRLVGRPSRTYLVGVSMGGHVTARSIEQYPSLYDGALPMCGVVGDVKLFDYFVDYTFVSQALAGVDAYPIPANYGATVAPQIQATLGTTNLLPGRPLTNPLGLQFRSIVVNQSGGPRPGAEAAFAVWKNFLFGLPAPDDGGMLSLNPGRIGTNVGTVYEPDGPFPINDEVRRVAVGDHAARRSQALGPIPLIDGKPHVPVLTLHDLGDLFVPFSMEQYYEADVTANHRSDLLVQRAIRGVEHCDFSSKEVLTAFDDLVGWVENGVKPGGDDISEPTVVADQNFGCQYTDPAATTPSRVLFPKCS
jgi:pimeloyl-ACP methyl ester carboxylesterase